MNITKALSKISLVKHEDMNLRKQRVIRMKSLPDEDAGIVFWEDFCDLHGWPKTPNITNLHRYDEVFVKDKEKEINRRLGLNNDDEGYLSGHDLFIKPVLKKIQARILPSHQMLKTLFRPSILTLPPELLFMIVTSFHSKQDLHACTLVNRAWHYTFNPFLWVDIIRHAPVYKPNPFVRSIATTGSLKRYARLIQTLNIDLWDDDIERLMSAAPKRFPWLHSIELKGDLFADDLIASLLRKCSRRYGGVGLRKLVLSICEYVYEFRDSYAFGEESVEALKEHYSTLEVFRVQVPAFSSKEIQELLCSAPRLQEFNILPESRSWSLDEFMPSLNAHDIVQSSWVCLSLKIFGCPITGVPRPISKKGGIELQRQIYSQLARLKYLQELRLGISYDASDGWSSRRYDKNYDRQYDCLAMSLKSGLDLLSGLKELRVADLDDMNVGIDGENEQKWIAQHWPRVQVYTSDYCAESDDDSQMSESSDR
ncbi:hypothetical protein BGW42_006738 [Actinomortierella wolfii]|nr:hypothetical protein BGW42_006738 [Actinomortierella wolfii]